MGWDPGSGKTHPGSRVQKSTGSRIRSTCSGAELPILSIWDPDPTEKIELLHIKL
jgi:hypothetical protein